MYNRLGNASGRIDQAAWELLAEGSIYVTFYANDTLGNIGISSITVVKRLQEPKEEEFPYGALISILSIIAIAGIVAFYAYYKNLFSRIKKTLQKRRKRYN